ncbi:MAG: archaellin/type IV pilin N-terminal domain-containing protein [Candidatus Bathyarchaeia archaeon]
MSLAKRRRGVSPIIAAIVLIVIAITIGIGAAFWWSGIIQSFIGYESIELRLYTDTGEEYGTYKVTIHIKNTGTKDITININGIYLNEKPFWEANVTRVSFWIEDVNQTIPKAFRLPVGKKARIEIHLDKGYRSGQMVDVRLVTASGKEFYNTANLP